MASGGPGARRPARGVWVRTAAALLLGLLAMPPPAPAGAGEPPAFISRVAAFRPRTVECRVTITLHEGGGLTLEMYLWAVLPALWRLDVTGVSPPGGALAQMVGVRMVFQDDQVRLFDPTTGRVLEQRLSADLGNRPGASGRMGFTLAELLFVDDPTNYDLIAAVPQTVDGRSLVRYDFVLRRPQLVDRVLIARESIWVDPRSGEPLRAQLYDPSNRAVGIIVLKDHRRVPSGVGLPMTLELFMETGGPTSTARVTFQLKDGRFYLPLRIDAYAGTRPMMSIVYGGCLTNRPIDPARFQL